MKSARALAMNYNLHFLKLPRFFYKSSAIEVTFKVQYLSKLFFKITH